MAIRDAVRGSGDASVEELFTVWQGHVALEQQRIAEGHRPYVNSEVIDGEATQRVAELAGVTDPATVAVLAGATQRLPARGDSVAALDRLARQFPVLGLPNASRTALLRLNAHAGLRWHDLRHGTRTCRSPIRFLPRVTHGQGLSSRDERPRVMPPRPEPPSPTDVYRFH